MAHILLPERPVKQLRAAVMKANVFHAPGEFGIEEKPIPRPGPGEAVIRVHCATICGTDVHIVRGEYPVKPGLTIGHEAVGEVYSLGSGMCGYDVGQRVLVGAITPCGQCEFCLSGSNSQCGGALGGWRLGHTMDGVQAQYARIPFAQANLAPIPAGLRDEEVLLLADIASTGFAAAENAHIRFGDTVAIFAQGPIGISATLGAKLRGASEIFVVDADADRLRVGQKYGATSLLLATEDPVRAIRNATKGRGVDVAIEALGTQETFENSLRALRPGGILSSVGVYAGHLSLPVDVIGAGLSDVKIVTTLCPGGKERMRRLMALVQTRRIDLTPLITHVFPFEEIAKAYELFASRRERVLKVLIKVA